ncbi:MAG: hypothetical protein ACRDJM_01060 [Actinomycetota bacterium]
MTGPTTDQPPAPPSSYEDVRAARRATRKAERAARKAAKPKGIDLPFSRSMPRWLLWPFATIALVTLALVVVTLVRPPTPRIPVAERRSPPGPSVSHNVGPIVLAPIPDPLPPTGVSCAAFKGVVIEGGTGAQARVGGVLERLCPHAAGDSEVAAALRALAKARIRFARFARTGDFSTASIAEPARVVVNIRFAQRGVSAMYIAPLLAHEGFHLLHLGEPWSARLEFRARRVEAQTCRLVIDVDAWPRGCADAQRLVDFGEERATQMLVKAGFGP